MDADYVAFNGVDLRTIPFFEVDRRNANEMPAVETDTEKFARGHGSKLIQKNYRNKQIYINGHVIAPDRAQLDVAVDSLKTYLAYTEGSLDIVQGGVLRTYRATLTELAAVPIEAGKSLIDMVFTAVDPFGSATQQTAITFINPASAATIDQDVTFGGSWLAEPLLNVTLLSGTGLTNKTASISNPATGEKVSVTRNWTVNDVWTIDSENRQIYVNNVPHDYVGTFPFWDPGAGIIRYTDDFTTRSIERSGYYYKRYL